MDSWLIFDQQNQVQPVDETGGAVIVQEEQPVDYGAAVIGEAVILSPEDAPFSESVEPEQPTPETDPPLPPKGDNRVNVNSAEPDILEALPGIGAETVAKILISRDQSKFVSNDDLKQRVSSTIDWEALNLRFV